MKKNTFSSVTQSKHYFPVTKLNIITTFSAYSREIILEYESTYDSLEEGQEQGQVNEGEIPNTMVRSALEPPDGIFRTLSCLHSVNLAASS